MLHGCFLSQHPLACQWTDTQGADPLRETTFQAGHLAGRRVSILRGAVLPSTDDANAGEEHEMGKITDISEPASELERLIADLSESSLLVFVFGVGWWTAHLVGATAPMFRGPTDRRWWHVELGAGAAS